MVSSSRSSFQAVSFFVGNDELQFSSHFRFYLFWERNENHSYRYVCRRDHLKDAVSHTHGSLFVQEKINPVVQACRSFRFYHPAQKIVLHSRDSSHFSAPDHDGKD